jgi:Tol biopolymer transport system component
MRELSLISAALSACGLFLLSATAQETGNPAKTPTIDQSLEWKSAFNPKISPDGKRVVYEVQKTNWEDNAFERNLWIVDSATADSHTLTSAKKSSTNAAWSSDGKWIAFLSDRPGQIKDTPEGKKQIYMISADGGEAQQLTKTENDVNAFEWAPDSKRIAFSTTDPDPKTLKDRKEKYGEYSVVHADYQMAIFGPSRFLPAARLSPNRSA